MPQNAERRQTTNEDTPKYLHGSAGSEYVLECHAAKMSTYKSKSELFKQVTAQEQGVPHASSFLAETRILHAGRRGRN